MHIPNPPPRNPNQKPPANKYGFSMAFKTAIWLALFLGFAAIGLGLWLEVK
jgi:hypothetical protein